jgi:hypothetical protein
MQNKTVTRETIVRALSDENIQNREAEFVISTEAVDTYGTVFRNDGWNLKRYENNPIVAYGHRTGSDNPDMIIGVSEVRSENGQLIAKIRFEEESVNPLAEKIWRKVKAGTLRMASIGASILEYRYGDQTKGEQKDVLYFTRMELLEWSIVPIGSNPEALKRESQTIEEIRAAIIKEIPVVEEVRQDNHKELNSFEAQLIINSNL